MGAMTDHPPPAAPATRRVSGRIGAIAESATLKVDAKAKALKAEGRPVIGFGAGEPDFPTPTTSSRPRSTPAATRGTTATPPPAGCPSSRRRSPRRPGATAATRSSPPRCWSPTAASRPSTRRSPTMLDPGDEVIVPAPYWTTYPEAIQLAGGVAVPVLADETQDYKVTVEQLEAARTERTKVLLFVSPSNPTGAVYTADEIRAIGQLGRGPRAVGAHRRDLRAPRLRRRRDRLDAGAVPRTSPTTAWSSTASPRPTR